MIAPPLHFQLLRKFLVAMLIWRIASAEFFGTTGFKARYSSNSTLRRRFMMPIILWFLGVPISLIIVAALFGVF
ncbi:hypothetical protein [Bradyrhizobium sp.]|uniref:hypothetical protein n=1 Tax=Bradyrhizobium sp. TaxID=376 RepID=UPI002735B57D|nr:hypothetical protein [Bradyrhizobium sp.]MDP3691334.1 hypothetical protein [Bradyrhizobium sp.]